MVAIRIQAGLVTLGAVLALLTSVGSAAANPDPIYGSLMDGCQRNPAGLLSYSSPEWVDVGGKQSGDSMRELQGGATLAHTADEDLPESHSSYDMDFDVTPDAAFKGLLAGDPSANGGTGSGNYAPGADQGKMHVEWESGSVPTFAWPTEADRIHMWGQWTWDCGHWGQGITTDSSSPQNSLVGTGDYFLPGQIEGPPPPGLRGEQTELHPIQALAVTRAASYRASSPQLETDFFASNDGTHAYAEAQCAKSLTPIPGLSSYGPDFSACVNTPSNNVADLHGRTFHFFAPAPPKPSPGATLAYTETPMVSGSGFREQVTPAAGGLDITVTNTQSSGDTSPASIGASYFVGWTPDASPPPVHLRWTLKSITVFHALAEPNPQHPTVVGLPGIGVYNLYVDLNGYWNFLGGKGLSGATGDDSWVPGLGAVTDGQSFTVNRTVDFFVPPGAPVRIDISGRECDLPRIAPCVANAEVSDGNDHPGEAIDQFASASASIGDHTLKSPVPSPADPNYQLTYSIAQGPTGGVATPPGSSGVPPSSPGGGLGGGGTVLTGAAGGGPAPGPAAPGGAGAGTAAPAGAVAGGSCAGTRLRPSSRWVRHSRNARRRLVLRGRSREQGCGASSRRAGIVTVRVAIARLVGGRCRFLRRRGFTASRPCRFVHSVRAHGGAHWRLTLRRHLPAGRYEAWVSAHDRAGTVEQAKRVRFTLR